MKKIILPLLFLLSLTASSQSSELTVIGNKTAVPSQLSLGQVQNIFKGNQPKWSTGDKVIIALMKLNTDPGKATCSKVYQMSPDNVTRYWLSLSIKGTIDAPVFFNTGSELENFVANTRGAIGILSAPAAAATKTILVDGKKIF